MKGRPDPTEDARQRLMTPRLLAAAVGLAILIIVLLARRVGTVG